MIRLTLLLLICIGVTFVIAGQDPGLPEGSDQPTGIEVTRLAPQPAASRPEIAPLPRDENVSDLARSIALNNHQAALEAALQATEAGGPAPAPALDVAAAAPADAVLPDAPAAPAPDYWYVTGTRVNLRSGPSTSTAVIGQVTFGQEALVLEETADGWFRIETAQNGATGFIFGQFLSDEAPL